EPVLAAGSSPDRAWPELRAALAADAGALQGLLDRPVQTNEIARCAALLPGFLAAAGSTGIPLRLLEVGASAGLNLRWDRYAYQAGAFSWGDPNTPVRIAFELEGTIDGPSSVEVAERRGCDLWPIDPTWKDGALTLLSYVWADQESRLQRMRSALRVAP